MKVFNERGFTVIDWKHSKKTEDEKALATPEDGKYPAVLRNLDVLKLILKSTLCDFKRAR